MKALVSLIVVGAVIYFFANFGHGRVGGPMSPLFSVSYRDSIIGHGIVLKIGNHTEETFYDVRVKIANHNGQSTSANVVDALKPGEEKEVGWMELHHWQLDKGEEVSIYAKGYPAPFVTTCSAY